MLEAIVIILAAGFIVMAAIAVHYKEESDFAEKMFEAECKISNGWYMQLRKTEKQYKETLEKICNGEG